MSRLITVAALAAAFTSLAAMDASASTSLKCSVNTMDGQALKVRIVVTNTTGQYIKEGTPITLRILTRTYGYYRYRFITINSTVYQGTGPSSSIGFNQPAGSRSCSASIA